jgi:hypothetical protein
MQLAVGAATANEVALFNRIFYARFSVYFSVGFMLHHNRPRFYKYNKMCENAKNRLTN